MRVIGICRFSYPAHGGFRRMHDTLEEREAYLYHDTRMELRFRHFEALTLPSVAAQTNPDFTLLIVIGERMPKKWLDRLHDVTAPVPQIKIVPTPPLKHRLALQLAIQKELEGHDEESMQFRLDDDDAIGVDFVQKALFAARRTGRFRKESPRMAFEFNNGFSVNLSQEGLRVRPEFGGFLSCGLAVLFPAGDDKTVMNFGHHKLHHSMPMMIQPTPPMYLRAKHDDNDSGAKFQPKGLEPATDTQVTLIKERFNVSADQIASAFSAPLVPHG
ncbi:glycosyltransferase [Roseovarius sp. E0-M6]|uniref:glycosyltransferase n=1 Tax=Roseovarius sp. E0-M6 TaxID=3127118 RepID=UPI0030105BF1